MILKMMTASWNLHWQMKIHLYYPGPAWAAEALQMLRNPLGRYLGYSFWYSTAMHYDLV